MLRAWPNPGCQPIGLRGIGSISAFRGQVYDTEIGQIRFEKRYYVPEEVYYRMISPLTLHRGGKTLLRGTERFA